MSRDAVTKLLATATGSPDDSLDALDDLMPLVYDELRRIAHAQLPRGGGRLTLDTTGLVHEAYLKLVDSTKVTRRGRAYFFGAAARAMRQVLVDAARKRGSKKRGADIPAVTLDEGRIGVEDFAAEILELDAALQRLQKEHPRPAQVLECRFFGGLGVDETAQVLDLGARTVERDWALARAWLVRELEDTGSAGSDA